MWRLVIGRDLPVASGEDVIADLAECVIKVLQSLHDVLPARLVRRIQGGLQAEADSEKVAGDPVEQVLAEVRQRCRGGGLRCWRPFGDGRLPAGVGRDQGIKPIQAQDAADDLGGCHQSQLPAAGHDTQVSTDQGLRAIMIT